jgi:hypothetical protein
LDIATALPPSADRPALSISTNETLEDGTQAVCSMLCKTVCRSHIVGSEEDPFEWRQAIVARERIPQCHEHAVPIDLGLCTTILIMPTMQAWRVVH